MPDDSELARARQDYDDALDERDDCDHIASAEERATQEVRIASARRRRDELLPTPQAPAGQTSENPERR